MEVKTNKDALAAWDRGEPIQTCEMGGFSDGYERAIHIMGMEMLRAMETRPFDWEAFEKATGPEQELKWKVYRDAVDAQFNVMNAVDQAGASGAQVGAAMSLASMFHRHGYEEAIKKVPQERLITVAKV
ncbi:hypothetical protein [Paremcibacter congregatus]|uniref:hypothetical protein n=1 Tax=Paremcibacter congregatus TaxID=2043170 RepID=UPI003A8F51C4